MAANETEIRLFEPQIQALRTATQDLARRIVQRYIDSGAEPDLEPGLMLDRLEQFFDIVQTNANPHGEDGDIATQEMQQLGDYGLGLLDELIEWAEALEMEEEQQALQMITIPLALLAIREGMQLRDMDTVVNALSIVANDTHHPGQLAELSEVMEEVINATAPEVREELDRSNPQRPWRILNLNHAIVATRSHDPQIMEATFQQLLYRLPDDAPGFFAEGMEQMDIVGYPEHVRELMKKYYELSHNPTLH